MLVHVLLYQAGKDTEGIHSLELAGKTVVLMFENKDDAERYCGLLEAQDFPCPTVDCIPKDEIEQFCLQSGYSSRLVESGFIPKTEEDRILLSPPSNNLDVSSWQDQDSSNDTSILDEDHDQSFNLDQIKKNLEGLL